MHFHAAGLPLWQSPKIKGAISRNLPVKNQSALPAVVLAVLVFYLVAAAVRAFLQGIFALNSLKALFLFLPRHSHNFGKSHYKSFGFLAGTANLMRHLPACENARLCSKFEQARVQISAVF